VGFEIFQDFSTNYHPEVSKRGATHLQRLKRSCCKAYNRICSISEAMRQRKNWTERIQTKH